MRAGAPYVAFWCAIAVVVVAAITNDALVDIFGCAAKSL